MYRIPKAPMSYDRYRYLYDGHDLTWEEELEIWRHEAWRWQDLRLDRMAWRIAQKLGDDYADPQGVVYTAAQLNVGGVSYPQSNQVVVLAGGAGSGKSFQKTKILGIDGYPIDIDWLKELILRGRQVKDVIKKQFGYDITSLCPEDMANPDVTRRVHEACRAYGLKNKWQLKFLKQFEEGCQNDRRPNMIFDVTLSDIHDIYEISNRVKEYGYRPENIHIVWVLDKVSCAIEKQKGRTRQVPDYILKSTHSGVSSTMSNILSLFKESQDFAKVMNGDIWVSFNSMEIDWEAPAEDTLVDTGYGKRLLRKRGEPDVRLEGSVVVHGSYFCLKRRGQAPNIAPLIRDKILRYIPAEVKSLF